MKTKPLTLLGLILVFTLFLGNVQEVIAVSKYTSPVKITGAFGLNLYEKLDPNIVKKDDSKNLLKDFFRFRSGNWKKIKPPIPNKMFESYYVKVTPKLKKIISIVAIGFRSTRKRCSHSRKNLDLILTKKFGKKWDGFSWWDDDGNTVHTVCDTPSSNTPIDPLDPLFFLRTYAQEAYLMVNYSLFSVKAKDLVNQELFEGDPLDSSGL
jgi:hypothetical protein